MKLFYTVGLLISQLAGAAFDQSHNDLTKVLAENVKAGVVDYAAIKKNPAELDKYLSQIGSISDKDYKSWPKPERMAYLINAYNAFTLKMISDFYPVDSIRSIGARVGGGIFSRKSKQWNISEYEKDGKKVTFKAMGRTITLDEIEHKNLRPNFQDYRVHFALVCGALSCPPLRSEAFTGAKLDQQLDAQGRAFFADPFRNQYDAKSNSLKISKIFDWFHGDFERTGSSVQKVAKKYLPESQGNSLSDETKISFLEYDWSLNDKAPR